MRPPPTKGKYPQRNQPGCTEAKAALHQEDQSSRIETEVAQHPDNQSARIETEVAQYREDQSARTETQAAQHQNNESAGTDAEFSRRPMQNKGESSRQPARAKNQRPGNQWEFTGAGAYASNVDEAIKRKQDRDDVHKKNCQTFRCMTCFRPRKIQASCESYGGLLDARQEKPEDRPTLIAMTEQEHLAFEARSKPQPKKSRLPVQEKIHCQAIVDITPGRAELLLRFHLAYAEGPNRLDTRISTSTIVVNHAHLVDKFKVFNVVPKLDATDQPVPDETMLLADCYQYFPHVPPNDWMALEKQMEVDDPSGTEYQLVEFSYSADNPQTENICTTASNFGVHETPMTKIRDCLTQEPTIRILTKGPIEVSLEILYGQMIEKSNIMKHWFPKQDEPGSWFIQGGQMHTDEARWPAWVESPLLSFDSMMRYGITMAYGELAEHTVKKKALERVGANLRVIPLPEKRKTRPRYVGILQGIELAEDFQLPLNPGEQLNIH